MATVSSKSLKDEYQVIVVGDMAVGKTSLIHRYSKETVLIDPEASSGFGLMPKEVEIDGEKIIVHIWDTAGQERFRTLMPSYYRSAEAVIIVYDITRKQTFESLQYWLDECDKHFTDRKVPKIIIANKCDCQSSKEVTTKDGQMFAKKHNIPFYETTSKMDSDIKEIFLTLLRKLQINRSLMPEENSPLYVGDEIIKLGTTPGTTTGTTNYFRHLACCSGNSNDIRYRYQ